MGKPLKTPPPGFDDLSVEEQIDYLQELWDRISASSDAVPVPDWHIELLERRVAEAEADPDDAVAWEEVRDELRSGS